MSVNPYNWQSHSPRIQVPRDGVERAAELMRNNGSAVAKSVASVFFAPGGRLVVELDVVAQLQSEERGDRCREGQLEGEPP